MLAPVRLVNRASEAAAATNKFRQMLPGYAQELRCELLRYSRNPSFILPILLFPVLFFGLFGVLLNHDLHARQWLLGSYLAFGLMSPGLYSFGVALSIERENGAWQLRRTQPAPPAAYLLSKLAMSMLVGVLIGLVMLLMGTIVAGLSVSLQSILQVLLLSAFGGLPFAALGMWLGSVWRGAHGPGFINMVYLPLAALSGLWFPLSFLPAGIAHLLIWSPAWRLGQLSLCALGQPAAPLLPNVLVLLAYTLLFTVLAVRRLQTKG